MKTRERAKSIITGRRQLDTIGDQFWMKSERGKAWELWGSDGKLLRRFYRIPCSRVLWVIPEVS